MWLRGVRGSHVREGSKLLARDHMSGIKEEATSRASGRRTMPTRKEEVHWAYLKIYLTTLIMHYKY